MQLSPNFKFLNLAFFVLALTSAGKATPLAGFNQTEIAPVGEAELVPAPYIKSHDEMMHWLETTNANLTFVGEPLNPLAPRAAEATTVVYCTTIESGDCAGDCTVYIGGAKCLDAPGTQCLSATRDVSFCTGIIFSCFSGCNQLSNCANSLSTGFCVTPGTRSIDVS